MMQCHIMQHIMLTTNHWSLLVLYWYIDTLHCQGLKYNKNMSSGLYRVLELDDTTSDN